MDSQTALRETFRTLYQTGFGIIDIGSREGLHPVFNGVASLGEVVGFEPDIEECKRLNDNINSATRYRSLKFLPFGLGSADGERTLHLCRSRGNSSLYKPNRSLLDRFPDASRWDIESELTIPVRSLDGIIDDPKIDLPKHIDFVKIDTQGTELEILKGARKTLFSQVVGVEVEVEFARLYDSSALFREVDLFLSEIGFTLFRLRRFEWVRRNYEYQPELSAGQLVFGDALYLRDPLNSESPWMPKDSHQAEALALIATLFDLHDFALEIISEPEISAMLHAGDVRSYILQRNKKFIRLWKPLCRFMDILRLIRAELRWDKSRLRRYQSYQSAAFAKRIVPHWGRGDSDFYSRVD